MVIHFSLSRKKKMQKPAGAVAKAGGVCDNKENIC